MMYADIEQATDASAVSSVLLEAAQWLIDTGQSLWQPAQLTPQALQSDVAAGHYYLAHIAGEAVGTVRFQLDDPEFWPDALPGRAAYVHRLAVRRRWAGSGISNRLLEFAAERARELGQGYLRLDTVSDRHRLRAYYERFGFRHHSDFQAGPWHVARYELPLATPANAV
jgi:GNAT superfamily N-acetyltransferase